MRLPKFEYLEPKTLKEATHALASPAYKRKMAGILLRQALENFQS